MKEKLLALPLEMIQLKEEEMALLKGGANEDLYMNTGCDCNCGDCCSAHPIFNPRRQKQE